MTHLLETAHRKAAPPVSDMETLTWRPCREDVSIWRMLRVQPDRELFATINMACAELLFFEVEDDLHGTPARDSVHAPLSAVQEGRGVLSLARRGPGR